MKMAFPITGTALRWLEVIFAEWFGNTRHLTRTDEGLRLQLADSEGAILFDKLEQGFIEAHSNQPCTLCKASSERWRSVAFYFIPERTDPIFDGQTSLYDSRIRKLLCEIHQRGHEIGFHPGYNTYRHPDNMTRSAQSLRKTLDDLGIAQKQIGGRQHFLRWETPITSRLLDINDLHYDSTLSYTDRPGFRCDTCFEYPMFDAGEQSSLRLRQRPLIVMECSVIAKRYLGSGYSEAYTTRRPVTKSEDS